jgi:hypothetical protein
VEEAMASTAAKRVVLFMVEDIVADLFVENVVWLKRVEVIKS